MVARARANSELGLGFGGYFRVKNLPRELEVGVVTDRETQDATECNGRCGQLISPFLPQLAEEECAAPPAVAVEAGAESGRSARHAGGASDRSAGSGDEELLTKRGRVVGGDMTRGA